MRNPVNRNKGGQKTRRQGGQGARIDVHVGIQRKVSFLNAELDDVTEAHGDFRAFYFIEAFYGSEHLNITTSSGDEIDDDASASVA